MFAAFAIIAAATVSFAGYKIACWMDDADAREEAEIYGEFE